MLHTLLLPAAPHIQIGVIVAQGRQVAAGDDALVGRALRESRDSGLQLIPVHLEEFLIVEFVREDLQIFGYCVCN